MRPLPAAWKVALVLQLINPLYFNGAAVVCADSRGGETCEPVECPPGALLEDEPCGSSTNEGCNSVPNQFIPISCGDVYCGFAWAQNGNFDTDWYQLVLTENTTITVSATGEFPLFIGVVNTRGFEGCGSTSLLDSASAPPNAQATLTAPLFPGTWLFYIRNATISGYPCGTCNTYTVSLTCTPGGNPNSCVNWCGKQAPGGCACDEVCCVFNDCCDDKFAACCGCDPSGTTDNSCVCHCGDWAPGGCWCDEGCCTYQDCCDDKFAVCGGCDPKKTAGNSCLGFCGGQAPGGCYCDPQCCDFGDCCFDMQTVCFVCRTNPFSCAGFCGASPGACWCDEACCSFSDCCPDKFVECGGCNPFPLSCFGSCGGQAPGGCFCDEACCDFMDCCDDKTKACGGCIYCGFAGCDSCLNFCGQQSMGGCWCDEECCIFSDCCDDKFKICGGCDPSGTGDPNSCDGDCGGQAPGGCWCDEKCCAFADCCTDKFEFCGGCNPNGPTPPGDINGDGVVNVADLLAVINSWGACPLPPQGCPSDIAPAPSGDDVVNVSDLLMVINNWG